MDRKVIISKAVLKLAGKPLGKDVINQFQSDIVPLLKKVQPKNIIKFIEQFQARHKLDDSQAAVLIEKLVEKYQLHKQSQQHLDAFKDIAKMPKFKKPLGYLNFYFEKGLEDSSK